MTQSTPSVSASSAPTKSFEKVFGETGTTEVEILDLSGDVTGTVTMTDGVITQNNYKPYENIFGFPPK